MIPSKKVCEFTKKYEEMQIEKKKRKKAERSENGKEIMTAKVYRVFIKKS
jgi:hypothetical protein